MPVYRHILVTIDCSGVDDAIVDHVAALARQNDATVDLLHVVHSHTLDQDSALRRQAERELDRHRRRLAREGIRVRTVLRSGEPEHEILTQVREGDYDLVAMATHGHGGMGDLLFGSVSNTLKHKLTIPLLLVRGER